MTPLVFGSIEAMQAAQRNRTVDQALALLKRYVTFEESVNNNLSEIHDIKLEAREDGRKLAEDERDEIAQLHREIDEFENAMRKCVNQLEAIGWTLEEARKHQRALIQRGALDLSEIEVEV